MRGQALLALAAMAGVLGLAQPAAAEHYSDRADGRYSCEQIRSGRTAAGAVIGAILGGVIGNNVAHDQSDGTVGGAIVGGVAGAAIARSANRCDQGYYPEGDAGPEAYPEPYGDDSDLYGGPNDERRYNEECRWGDMTYYDDRGRRQHDRVWMCRDERGQWRPAE